MKQEELLNLHYETTYKIKIIDRLLVQHAINSFLYSFHPISKRQQQSKNSELPLFRRALIFAQSIPSVRVYLTQRLSTLYRFLSHSRSHTIGFSRLAPQHFPFVGYYAYFVQAGYMGIPQAASNHFISRLSNSSFS